MTYALVETKHTIPCSACWAVGYVRDLCWQHSAGPWIRRLFSFFSFLRSDPGFADVSSTWVTLRSHIDQGVK